MTAVMVRLASEVRSRWPSWVGLTLLIGLFGGVVLASAAGARRTDSAFPRLVDDANAPDYLVAVGYTGLESGFYEEVERLPEVADAAPLAGHSLIPAPDGPLADVGLLDAVAGVDGRYGVMLDRPKLLSGRLPDPTEAGEALANAEMARALDLEVGEEVTLLAPSAQYTDPSAAEPATFTVVGVGLFPHEVVPGSLLDAQPRFLLTPAYFEAHRSDERNYDGVAVRLRPGADPDAFRQAVLRLADVHGEDVGEVFLGDNATFHGKTQRAIRPQAVALALFAALAGAATLLVAGQTLSRLSSQDAAEYPALRAIGMTRNQLLALHVARSVAVGLVGGALAVAVALLSSPFMPIGPARLAEPHPGFALDATVLGWGFLAMVVLLAGWAMVPAWRAASAPAGTAAATDVSATSRPSRLARVAAGLGLPASATTGVRMALEPGRGRTAVPVRSALAGTAMAIAAVAATVTFATNLNRLVSTPSMYGQGWDIALDTGFGAVALEEAAPILEGPAVAGYSGGRYGEVGVEGVTVPAVGIDLIRGEAFPTILEGRPPRGPGEIVLGTTSLRALGSSLGDTVDVAVAGTRSPMRVVGRAVFPRLGRGSFPPTGLGEGAAVAAEVMPLFEAPPGDVAYSFFLVRFADDADRAVREALAEEFHSRVCAGPLGDCFLSVEGDQRPADVSNYERVQSTPMVLSALLVALAVATLTHTLVTWARRRRRDLAVLRAVGFVRRQVSSTVAWQATTLAVLATLVGLPLGVAGGRWLWLVFARQLGVGTAVMVPSLFLLVTVPVVIVVANVVAAVPGLSAAGVRPAVVLRTE